MASKPLKNAYWKSASMHAGVIIGDYFKEEIWRKQGYGAATLTPEVKGLLHDAVHYAMTRKLVDLLQRTESGRETREETLKSVFEKGGLYHKEASELLEEFAKEMDADCREKALHAVKMALVRRSYEKRGL